MSQPYLSPESTYCRVWRERAVYAGLFRAVVLQATHPLALTGVVTHSAWMSREMGARFLRNYKMMRVIGFAPREETDKLLDVVDEMHRRVKGRLHFDDGGPRYPAGMPYTGMHPDAMLWILMSIMDSAEVAYETFVAPLSAAEKAENWRDTRLAGRLFGMAEEDLPRTRADLDAYVDEMLSGDGTRVTELARRRVGGFVMAGNDPEAPPDAADANLIPWFATPGWELIKSFTMLTIPERHRIAYGFPNEPWRQRLVAGAGAASRAAHPRLPKVVKWWPEARRAGEPWAEIAIKQRRNGHRYLAEADASSIAEDEPVAAGGSPVTLVRN